MSINQRLISLYFQDLDEMLMEKFIGNQREGRH
jgi:hypothetical protein